MAAESDALHHTNLSSTYHVAMLVLSLYAIVALAAEAAVHLDPQIRQVLTYADYAVCMLFAGDFLLSLWRSPRRLHYLATWGWVDLLSSIPMLSVARWGRVARVARVLRVLRGVRATKEISGVLLRNRARNTFLAASLLALLMIVVCSIAVLHFETVPEANIRTAEDAVWWAFTTMTTVGYGDRYPVTSEGRFVAVILMCAGVGLFGAFSGFLAAWFLESDPAHGDSELAKLRSEIAGLRELLERNPRPQVPTE
ncbi:MAG: kcsA [Acidobacteria bacterium]|nr:kcsA [Acidobacteriota bacterium]